MSEKTLERWEGTCPPLKQKRGTLTHPTSLTNWVSRLVFTTIHWKFRFSIFAGRGCTSLGITGFGGTTLLRVDRVHLSGFPPGGSEHLSRTTGRRGLTRTVIDCRWRTLWVRFLWVDSGRSWELSVFVTFCYFTNENKIWWCKTPLNIVSLYFHFLSPWGDSSWWTVRVVDDF